VKRDNMFIDVGATSGDETERMGIRIGDPVVPYAPFTLINEGKVAAGKAFDDRVGAVIAIETVRRFSDGVSKHPNTLFGVATVMEEVGLRGATTAAHVVDPDVAIVLEVDIAGDVPGIRPRDAPAKMGKGPSLVTYEASMIPNQTFKELAIQVAEEEKIPYQLSLSPKGGTDAGRIHLHKTGCPTIVLCVPTRHIHSHVALLSISDLTNAIKWTESIVKKLDMKTVQSLTS
jgi:putative aminopeptidase FrvX